VGSTDVDEREQLSIIEDIKYSILRPPIAENFYLPTRDNLLSLKKGDIVKLIFSVGDEPTERMWVILEDCSNDMVWNGVVDNVANSPLVHEILPVGAKVLFHPLDIIQYYIFNE
jgi:hypothetical protein